MPRDRERRPARPQQQQQTENGSSFDGVMLHVAQREGARQIKLHESVEKATSKQEAEVLTGAGLPDMRFANDKMKFQRDPRRRVRDGKPDRRFLENRPDLLEARRRRGGSMENFIFTDDMLPENADEIAHDVEEAAAE